MLLQRFQGENVTGIEQRTRCHRRWKWQQWKCRYKCWSFQTRIRFNQNTNKIPIFPFSPFAVFSQKTPITHRVSNMKWSISLLLVEFSCLPHTPPLFPHCPPIPHRRQKVLLWRIGVAPKERLRDVAIGRLQKQNMAFDQLSKHAASPSLFWDPLCNIRKDLHAFEISVQRGKIKTPAHLWNNNEGRKQRWYRIQKNKTNNYNISRVAIEYNCEVN